MPWCKARNFQRDLAEYERRNAVVLGVSTDSASSHKDFCAKEGLHFKLLSDSKRNVSRTYGSITNLGIVKFSSRHTFLIDPQGKVVRSFTRINPNHHSEEVLTVLDQLSMVSDARPSS